MAKRQTNLQIEQEIRRLAKAEAAKSEESLSSIVERLLKMWLAGEIDITPQPCEEK